MANNKSNPPSTKETAFDCPHCGAYAAHTWFDLFAKAREGNSRTPTFHTPANLERLQQDKNIPADIRKNLEAFFTKSISGLVLLNETPEDPYTRNVFNLHLSQCYNCGEFSVWIRDGLVFPVSGEAPSANPDLPPAVRADYEEASKILNLSPRGSAALLRLAIQKLCAELGEKGENINDDIASLVRKGLNPTVQKALDAVRVIGNEAVHPGLLDLKDDRDTATQLFRLVNIIAEQMISNPKHVEEMYQKIPESKRRAIEERDGKKQTSDKE